MVPASTFTVLPRSMLPQLAHEIYIFPEIGLTLVGVRIAQDGFGVDDGPSYICG